MFRVLTCLHCAITSRICKLLRLFLNLSREADCWLLWQFDVSALFWYSLFPTTCYALLVSAGLQCVSNNKKKKSGLCALKLGMRWWEKANDARQLLWKSTHQCMPCIKTQMPKHSSFFLVCNTKTECIRFEEMTVAGGKLTFSLQGRGEGRNLKSANALSR